MAFLAPLVGPALGLYGASKAASSQRKAARRANEAAEQSVVDPAEVQRVARETAAENIRNSLALEQQYTPENAALRQGSIRELLARAGSDPTGDGSIDVVTELLSQEVDQPSVRSALLDRAIAQAAGDLEQGGRLPADVRNEVSRSSIARAGSVGGGRLGLARFITPRDLGVSSLALRESRLNRASQLGGQDVATRQQDVSNRMNATQMRSQLATLLANLGSNQFNRYLTAANFGQSLQPPQAGLSPGDIASLYTQNATNRAQAGQNAAALQAQTGRNTGQTLAGLGGMIQGVDWNRIFRPSTPPLVPAVGGGYLGDFNDPNG
jgi:hypothetical protein